MLHEVFCRASFVSKLKCEQVCKAWRSVLTLPARVNGQDGASATGLWGRQMCIVVEPTDSEERTMQVCGPPDRCDVVRFHETDAPDLSKREKDFVAWLTLRAAGFQSMTALHEHHSLSWLFPRLIMALGRCVRHTPVLTLNTGEPLQIFTWHYNVRCTSPMQYLQSKHHQLALLNFVCFSTGCCWL